MPSTAWRWTIPNDLLPRARQTRFGRRRAIRRKTRPEMLLLFVAIAATIATVVAWPWITDSGRDRVRSQSRPAASSPGLEGSVPATRPAQVGASIVEENRRPGTADWRIPSGTRTAGIEGYADRVSVVAGETVTLYVRATAPGFHVEAYRMGWYQGSGARLVWKSPLTPSTVQDKALVLSTTRTVEARWKPSLQVAIGADWTPGDYLLKLVADDGAQHYVPLTVRDDHHEGAIVVMNAVTTWQAYNQWGGYSLYKGPRADPKLRSTIVSFDRPYDADGSGDFLGNEYPFVSFVEQLGLDVTYWTDVDLHAHPERLLGQRAMFSLGHDEYWSLSMRNGAEAARDQGVNLGFLGANAVFRRIRLEPSLLGPMRHEVNYRVAELDPALGKDNAEVTTSWREAPASRPESSLVGVLYECNPVDADGVVADASSWILEGSGLRDGDHVAGLIGTEYDRVTPQVATPASIQVLFHSPLTCRGKASFADASYYTAPSGAGVFSTGTGWWVCKLLTGCPTDTPSKPDRRIRRITENVVRSFGGGPAGVAHPSSPNLVELGITKAPLVAPKTSTTTTVVVPGTTPPSV